MILIIITALIAMFATLGAAIAFTQWLEKSGTKEDLQSALLYTLLSAYLWWVFITLITNQ